MTSITETDTYLHVQKWSTSAGGVELGGFTSAGVAFTLFGYSTTPDTAKSNAATGGVGIRTSKKSGTGVTTLGATENIAVIQTDTTTRFIFQADGSSYEDVGTSWTNFDVYDDLMLLTDLSIAASRADDAIHQRFANFLRYSPDMLQAMDLIHFNEDGHHFANRSKIQMALIGASRQLGDRVTALEQRVIELETQLLALQGAS